MPKIKKFKENEPDNLHCLQACYIMAVHTLTGQWLSIEQAEKETGFVKGLPTWNFQIMLSLADKDLDVISMDNSDFTLFTKSVRAYIESFVEDEKEVESALNITNESLEQKRVIEILNRDDIEHVKKAPTVADINEFLEQDYIVIVNVNSHVLADVEGYAGHFVIVEEIYDDYVVLQDPGLPGKSNSKVPLDTFIKAWNYFGDGTGELTAVGKGK